MTDQSATDYIIRDGNFKVAVYLRETQPDRNPFQPYRFGSYRSAHQWHDQTYGPNPKKLDNTKSGHISETEMATSKWPSISERRSPTETSSNHIHLDRTRMPTNGMTKLTIQIPRNLDNTKSGYISGTEMATLKWPSISERRSPTETSSNHINSDRTRMPTNGMTKHTIRISNADGRFGTRAP